MIGATATIGTAIFQLIVNWRKQAGDRRVAKSGTKSFLWVVALMLASGVGGFAYSEYLSQARREDDRALHLEMQQHLQSLAASTAKLEQMQLSVQTVADRETRQTEERRRGAEGVEALAQVPACKARQGGACAEGDAARVAVCAAVPAKAQVTEVQLFTRSEESLQPWGESRVTTGQDAGNAKFLDGPVERFNTESTKQVCYTFAHWGTDKGRTARIVVRYTL
jgi:hypothetical protein